MVDWSSGFQKRIPQKYRAMIDDVSDEHESGDGYWVYFVPGYRSTDTDAHCIHEWTMADLLKSVRHSIVECDCEDCKELMKER